MKEMQNAEWKMKKTNLAQRGVVAGMRVVCGANGRRYHADRPPKGRKLAEKYAAAAGEETPICGGSLAWLEGRLNEKLTP